MRSDRVRSSWHARGHAHPVLPHARAAVPPAGAPRVVRTRPGRAPRRQPAHRPAGRRPPPRTRVPGRRTARTRRRLPAVRRVRPAAAALRRRPGRRDRPRARRRPGVWRGHRRGGHPRPDDGPAGDAVPAAPPHRRRPGRHHTGFGRGRPGRAGRRERGGPHPYGPPLRVRARLAARSGGRPATPPCRTTRTPRAERPLVPARLGHRREGLAHLPGGPDPAEGAHGPPVRPPGRPGWRPGRVRRGPLPGPGPSDVGPADGGPAWPCVGTAVLHVDARTIAPYLAEDAVLEALPDHSCRLTTGSWSWPALAALFAGFDADFVVTGPDALRDAVQQVADRLRSAAPE